MDVPQIVIKDGEGDRQGNTAELDETIKQVNFDIEETISRLVAEFQASAELGESYGELEVRHETVTDDDRYFSLKLFIYQGAGSGTQSYKIYTIDKVYAHVPGRQRLQRTDQRKSAGADAERHGRGFGKDLLG